MPRQLRLTFHARKAITDRHLDPAWIARAVCDPDAIEPDALWPDALRAFKAIPEREGRVLRVVYIPEGEDAARPDRVLRPRPTPMIDTHHDPGSDILYVRFGQAAIRESEEVAPGVVLDLDESGRIVAVEIQRAKTHLTDGADLIRLTAA